MEHLDKDGQFVLNLIFPHSDLLDNVETEKEWFTYPHPDGSIVRVSGTEYYDPIRQVKVETAYRRWSDVNRNEIVRVAPLSLRYFFSSRDGSPATLQWFQNNRPFREL